MEGYGVKANAAFALGVLLLFTACGRPHSDAVYTLYRGSVLPDVKRVHVATFDALDGESYNSENCSVAANLFQQQRGVRVNYWCEKGYFH